MAVNYYTARSNDDLRKLAEQQYQSYYDMLRTAARQRQEREALALENQRAGIQRSYDKKREASDKAYREAYSQTDRETLRRGMQRSSYAAQRLANVNQQGIEANQNIWDEQLAAEGNLDAQLAQLQGQLADTLAGYDANQAADVMARYNELQSEEYDRAREAAQYAESIRQWQTQYDESVRQFNIQHPQTPAGGGSSSGNNQQKPPPGTGDGSDGVTPPPTDDAVGNMAGEIVGSETAPGATTTRGSVSASIPAAGYNLPKAYSSKGFSYAGYRYGNLADIRKDITKLQR